MRLTITIADDIEQPVALAMNAAQIAICYWSGYKGYWSPGASIIHESLGLVSCTRKTDAGWAVRVYNLNTEVE